MSIEKCRESIFYVKSESQDICEKYSLIYLPIEKETSNTPLKEKQNNKPLNEDYFIPSSLYRAVRIPKALT